MAKSAPDPIDPVVLAHVAGGLDEVAAGFRLMASSFPAAQPLGRMAEYLAARASDIRAMMSPGAPGADAPQPDHGT